MSSKYFQNLDPNFYNENSKHKELRRKYFTPDCLSMTDPENKALCKSDPDRLEKKLKDPNYNGPDY